MIDLVLSENNVISLLINCLKMPRLFAIIIIKWQNWSNEARLEDTARNKPCMKSRNDDLAETLGGASGLSHFFLINQKINAKFLYSDHFISFK